MTEHIYLLEEADPSVFIDAMVAQSGTIARNTISYVAKYHILRDKT